MANRVEQIENKVSGIEEKAEELDQSFKEDEKKLRKHEWNMQDLWSTIIGQPVNHWSKEREEIETRGKDNSFNNIIAENFLIVKKGRNSQTHFRTPNRQYQKRKTPL
jgi:hypothetical protein